MSLLKIRQTVEEDRAALRSWWVDEPDVLRWFPMINAREIEDSVRVWMTFALEGGGLTVEINGEPVGMAVLNFSGYEKCTHQCLISIIVGGNRRGQGIGTQLMEALETLAREKKLEFLHLEVYDENPAKHLYDRFGYTTFGHQAKFSKEGPGSYRGKTLMQKRL